MQEYYHMDKTREVGGGGASHGDAGGRGKSVGTVFLRTYTTLRTQLTWRAKKSLM